jgi:acyl-CoA reductase-like NAD-dependent aldehyde dehydrogenase
MDAMTKVETRDESRREYTVKDPATGAVVKTYPLMDAAKVDAAVARARAAFPAWSATPFAQRRRIFKRAAGVLAENAVSYADRIAAENGKTRLDALLADVFAVADHLKYYARHGEKFLRPVRVSGSILLPGRKGYYTFEPKGVVGVISPWNYPFTLSAGPTIAALMAGNTVVLKPSEQTTDSGIMVREILELAGLPRGVVEVVTGPGSITGQALIEHPGLDMLFFTGSTAIGRRVNVKAAERLIPAVMELGGKDVAIVTRHADLDRAAHGAAWGSFFNTGQTCIGTELILVDRAVYPEFVEKLKAIVGCLRPGKKAGQLGAMTMSAQYDIVADQLDDALAKGAKCLVGAKPDRERDGRFFPPVVLTDTTPDMKVRTDETFGPLKPVIPYDTIDEAVAIANANEYGLSGSVYTQDLKEGRYIARRLKTGSVNINDALITYANPGLPFGGVKNSGVGRYHGKMGLRAFTDIKSITEFGWHLKREPFWYPLPENADLVAADTMRALFSTNPLHRLTSAARMVKNLYSIVQRERHERKNGCPYDYEANETNNNSAL